MSESVFPPRGRLRKKFTDIGPYFRIDQSNDEQFFFDCLAVCASTKAEPELREFYGWWLMLTKTEDGFSYHYQYGFYNQAGEWESKAIPKKHQAEATRSLQVFYEKITGLVETTFELKVSPAANLDSELVLSAA